MYECYSNDLNANMWGQTCPIAVGRFYLKNAHMRCCVHKLRTTSLSSAVLPSSPFAIKAKSIGSVRSSITLQIQSFLNSESRSERRGFGREKAQPFVQAELL